MRPFLFVCAALCLAGCSALAAPAQGSTPGGAFPPLKDYGPAPEITNTVWLNVDHPLRLADLRGKVVLLEMWTFDCINCQHVIPALKDWYARYRDRGLVIIADHFPEFPYEASLDNLKQAVQRLQIPYPVAQDNSGATWNAYSNLYWPAMYLIDRTGQIRYKSIGEGGYPQTEAAIQALLAEASPTGR